MPARSAEMEQWLVKINPQMAKQFREADEWWEAEVKKDPSNKRLREQAAKNRAANLVMVKETAKIEANSRTKATKAKPPSAKHPKGVKAQSAARNTLKKREAQSQTAEYAPRVRVARDEEFDGAKLKKMIDPTHGGRLQVRVTGLLMYDSEHAFQSPLVRRTSWEIHPVFRLEFCPKGKDCKADSDQGWVDINK